MGGTGGGGEVIDLIHLNVQRINNVVMQHLEILVTNPLLNVSLAPSEVIISYKHLNINIS